jgi:hypothetical protein
LASIVLAGADTVTFLDFPAAADDEGTWRVGDAGTLRPEDFSVLFVVDGAEWKALAITWAGYEGEFIALATAMAPNPFHTITESYRYWLP